MPLKCRPHEGPSGVPCIRPPTPPGPKRPSGVPCIRPPIPPGPKRPRLPVMTVNGAEPDENGDIAIATSSVNTYTRSEIDKKIASVQTFSKSIVSELPEVESADDKTIYLVSRTNSETPDLCDEYVVVGESGAKRWERIGGAAVDITLDDAVTPTGENGVKSSGIWSSIWGALTALPAGFASIYDWCVAKIADKRDKTDLTVYDTPVDWYYDDEAVFVWDDENRRWRGESADVMGPTVSGTYLEYDETAGEWLWLRGSTIDHISAPESTLSLDIGDYTITRTTPHVPFGAKLATTADVPAVPVGDDDPLMDGAASPGSMGRLSRVDHVHPTDTTRRGITDLAVYDRTADWASDSGIVAVWDQGTSWSLPGDGHLKYIPNQQGWELYYPSVGGSRTYTIAADEDTRSLKFSVYVDGGEPEEITFTRTSIHASSGDMLASKKYVKDVLNYKPIEISKLTVSPTGAELGSTVTSATLTYTLNKEAASATLDDEAVTLSGTSGTIPLTGLSLTANKTWTLEVTEAESPAADTAATASKSVGLSFLNRVYWGAKAAPAEVNSAFIIGLGSSELSGSRARTKTVTAGEGQYIWFAYPARLGAATFKVGGFDGGFTLISDSFSHTNASGYTETYRVYRSDNTGLGTTTVVVS